MRKYHNLRSKLRYCIASEICAGWMSSEPKVSRPFTVAQVIDYSFTEKAQRDLDLTRK